MCSLNHSYKLTNSDSPAVCVYTVLLFLYYTFNSCTSFIFSVCFIEGLSYCCTVHILCTWINNVGIYLNPTELLCKKAILR